MRRVATRRFSQHGLSLVPDGVLPLAAALADVQTALVDGRFLLAHAVRVALEQSVVLSGFAVSDVHPHSKHRAERSRPILLCRTLVAFPDRLIPRKPRLSPASEV